MSDTKSAQEKFAQAIRDLDIDAIREAIDQGADVNQSVTGTPPWVNLIILEMCLSPGSFVPGYHAGKYIYGEEGKKTLEKVTPVIDLLLEQPLETNYQDDVYELTWVDTFIFQDFPNKERTAQVITSLIHDTASQGKKLYSINHNSIFLKMCIRKIAEYPGDFDEAVKTAIEKKEEYGAEVIQIIDAVEKRLKNPSTDKERNLSVHHPSTISSWPGNNFCSIKDLPEPSEEILDILRWKKSLPSDARCKQLMTDDAEIEIEADLEWEMAEEFAAETDKKYNQSIRELLGRSETLTELDLDDLYLRLPDDWSP